MKRNRSTLTQPAGFTLLELVLALALNLVLLTAVSSAIYIFLRGFQRADRDVAEAQAARAIFSLLAEDLRNLDADATRATDEFIDSVSASTPVAVALRGSRSRLDLLVRQSTLDLTRPEATTNEPGNAGPPSRVSRVVYALGSESQDGLGAASDNELQARPGLTRRQIALSDSSELTLGDEMPSERDDATAEKPASRESLEVQDVSDLRLRYFDGTQWIDDWDDTHNERPTAIEVVLGFHRENPLARRGSGDPSAEESADPTLPEPSAEEPLPAGAYRLVIALDGSARKPSLP